MWPVWGTADLYKLKPDGKKAKEDTIIRKENNEKYLQKFGRQGLE